MGEIELGLQFLKQPILALSGTNGKTTVALLAAHALKCAGLKARALGNIGDPLCKYALHAETEEIIVLELSSYQLETLTIRAADRAVLLNITPDHLDRYPDMEAYAKVKCHLQDCLKLSGSFLYIRVFLKNMDICLKRAIAHTGP